MTPNDLPISDVLHLQRAAGNRAVTRLLRPAADDAQAPSRSVVASRERELTASRFRRAATLLLARLARDRQHPH
jgi:hypothetical protein